MSHCTPAPSPRPPSPPDLHPKRPSDLVGGDVVPVAAAKPAWRDVRVKQVFVVCEAEGQHPLHMLQHHGLLLYRPAKSVCAHARARALCVPRAGKPCAGCGALAPSLLGTLLAQGRREHAAHTPGGGRARQEHVVVCARPHGASLGTLRYMPAHQPAACRLQLPQGHSASLGGRTAQRCTAPEAGLGRVQRIVLRVHGLVGTHRDGTGTVQYRRGRISEPGEGLARNGAAAACARVGARHRCQPGTLSPTSACTPPA